MFSAIWYIANNINNDTAKIIYSMASAVKNHARELNIKIIRADSHSSSIFERMTGIFKRADVWHLFGNAPIFWNFIRLHSKTVHTKINGNIKKWSGQPSYFFKNQILHGEYLLLPAFGSASVSSDKDKAIYTDSPERISDYTKNYEDDYKIINLADREVPHEALSGIYITYDDGILSALRCGLLAMRGLAIASVKSEYLNEILAPDGYFLIDDDSDMNKIIRYGLTDKGRHLAISARHFIKTRHSDEKSAESIFNLYRSIAGGKI